MGTTACASADVQSKDEQCEVCLRGHWFALERSYVVVVVITSRQLEGRDGMQMS